MKNFILTGTPGSGKTTVINAMRKKKYITITEAATDFIKTQQKQGIQKPWTSSCFIDGITSLQKKRRKNIIAQKNAYVFHDRSPICTYALAIYLNIEPSKALLKEIESIQKEGFYQKDVFFMENLGFIKNTHARQISFKQACEFEEIHKEAYKKFSYTCINIEKGSVPSRVKKILSHAESP